MGLMEQVKIDTQSFVQNKVDFGVDLTFTSPANSTVTVAGYYSDHSLTFDENGAPITGKKATVCVHEQSLIDAGYVSVRTQAGLISFKNHKVSIAYADGSSRTYKINEWQPDYTINLVTLFLEEYA